MWLAVFGFSTRLMGSQLGEFVPAFTFVYLAAMLIIALGQWSYASRYNLKAPLVALLLGLLIADAAGLAAAQAYGNLAEQLPEIEGKADDAVSAFTLMKVVGRDIWIGIWAFILSIVATTRFRELAAAGTWPFWAFTSGVLVNLIIGFLLSAVIFKKCWTNL